jgi:hypothetical protein
MERILFIGSLLRKKALRLVHNTEFYRSWRFSLPVEKHLEAKIEYYFTLSMLFMR